MVKELRGGERGGGEAPVFGSGGGAEKAGASLCARTERIFIELGTSDRKLKASREGSK